ncbi:MAG: pitrilysin family protein [Pseudomonadota bacterium]
MLHCALLALSLIFAGMTGAARAEQPVTSFTMENGMEVVVIEDDRAPVVTHMVWYRVGAADEPPGASGIAHFFEHMMFRGSEKFPGGIASKIIGENGGQENAFTSWDYTGYFQTIASDRLELVMDLESDRMANLIINEDVATTERKVIIEERNQRTDSSPQSLFGEQMRAALWLNHPYRIPIIGWRHEILELSVEDLTAFYERFYAPDNAILVVAGDVDPKEVLALADTYYGALEPSGQPPEPRPSEPPQLAPRRIQMTDPRVRQPYVMRYYLVPTYEPEKPERSAALYLLSQVLGSGIASRFSAQLQLEEKTALSTGSFYSPVDRDATSFGIYAIPTPGTDLATVEASLDAVLAEVAANGPTEEELERIKRKLRADRIYAQDSIRSQANLYGNALAVGISVEEVQNWPDVIEAITPEDVRAATALLDLDASVTGYLEREEEITQ